MLSNCDWLLTDCFIEGERDLKNHQGLWVIIFLIIFLGPAFAGTETVCKDKPIRARMFTAI